MTNNLYVIHDRVQEESGRINEFKNDATAFRAYCEWRDKQPNPDDFQLLCVGRIDHELNTITEESPSREVYPNVNLTSEEKNA